MKLSDEQLRALQLLASVGPRGCTEAVLTAHGFSLEMLAGLVLDGLAAARREKVMAGGNMIEVTGLRITGTGRDALYVG